MVAPVHPQISTEPGGIAFLGDGPRDEDAIKGWPFVDQAGTLLSQALRAAGLTQPGTPPPSFAPGQLGETKRLLWERRQHSFLNVFDTQIPDGDVKAWCAPAPVARTWEGYDLPGIAGSGYLRPEHAYHLDRLRGEFAQCRPHLIAPLGSIALWALTGNAAVDTYRGTVDVSTRLVPGIKLLPTYHPSHVIKQYKLLVVLIGDLIKAAREVQFPEVRSEPREIWLDPTFADIKEFQARYIRPGRGPLSVDIETGGGQISCISFSPTSTQSLVVPFIDYRQSDRSYWRGSADEVAAWAFVAEVLGDARIEKLFQNGGSYDVFWLLDKAGIAVQNYRHDLRLVHQVLYPELPKSLKFMGAAYANTHAWKANVHHDENEKRDA